MRCFMPNFILILLVFVLFGSFNSGVYAQTAHNFVSSKADSSEGGGDLNSNPARQWLKYYKDDVPQNYKSVMAFITKYPDFPAQEKLRVAAEKAMPSSLSDAEVLSWFSKNPPQTSFGMKLYFDALTKSGQIAKAKSDINEWWKTAKLTKDDQQRGLGYFQSVLTKSSHQNRLRILIHRDQYTNAMNLARVMGNDFVNYTQARIALREDKGNADQYLSRVPKSLQNDEGLLFDRLKFRRKAQNNSGAVEILSRSPSSDDMYDSEDWGKERAIIARRYFEEGQYSKAYNIAANHRIKTGVGFSDNEWFAGWVALIHLNKPWEAFQHFEKLYHGVESPLSKSRATYWAGRASERMKYPDIAKKWYEAGAKYPATFYGQLSTEKLGRDVSIPQNSVSPSDLKISAIAKATKWLKQNGHEEEAAIFLNKMIDISKAPQDYAAVADLANEISLKKLSIKAAQESEKKTGVLLTKYAFPKVEKYVSNIKVEWALVHGLIRQESRYDVGAISSANARGLMQLLPATAAEVAKKAGIEHRKEWLTSRPAHNIDLGSRYLQKLLNKYDGNYAMALAAYNAGPSRVDGWLDEIGDPRNKNIDLINWIESIPIYETRNYVQRVLEGTYVYRKILSHNGGEKIDAITHIAAQ